MKLQQELDVLVFDHSLEVTVFIFVLHVPGNTGISVYFFYLKFVYYVSDACYQ